MSQSQLPTAGRAAASLAPAGGAVTSAQAARTTGTAVPVPPSREAGMTTAEYAVGTVAAAGLGGVLYKLLTSDFFLALLKALFERAFGGIL